jgi:gas vesicle protein
MVGQGKREIESTEERLEDIIKNHQNRILEINGDTQKLIREVSADRKTGMEIGATLPILEKIGLLFKLDRSVTQKMNGEQILKMAEMEYAQARYIMDRISQDSGHNVLVESVKKQLDQLHEELKQVNEEISQAKNEDERKVLEKKKKEIKREVVEEED